MPPISLIKATAAVLSFALKASLKFGELLLEFLHLGLVAFHVFGAFGLGFILGHRVGLERDGFFRLFLDGCNEFERGSVLPPDRQTACAIGATRD